MTSKKYTHFESFEIEGRWWLPETPERSIYGTLHYSQTGRIQIELMGTLAKLVPGADVQKGFFFKEFEVVLGVTDAGKPCTAFRVIQTSGPLWRLDGGRSRVQVHRFYLGSHFKSKEEIQFSELTIEFAYLEEWLGKNPIFIETHSDPRKTVIQIPRKAEEMFRQRIEDRKTELAAFLGTTLSYNLQGQFAGARRAWIHVRPDGQRDREWYEEFMRSLGNFLTICIGIPVFPRRVKGTRALSGEIGSGAEEVDIFLVFREAREDEDVSHVQMPVPFSMIRDIAGSLILSWFSLQEWTEPLVDLLLSTYYNPNMYVETEFLTLMQACEVFHRRLIGGAYMDKEKWLPYCQELTRAIPDVLDDAHKGALRKRLEFGCEYSLRKRLGDLLKAAGEEPCKQITSSYEDFAGECVYTRNALVHEGKGGILSKGLRELWATNRRIRALLNVLVWTHLGLPRGRLASDVVKRLE